MPPNLEERERTPSSGPLEEKEQTRNSGPWDLIAFLIGAASDALQTVLIILKTPPYVYSTSKIMNNVL